MKKYDKKEYLKYKIGIEKVHKNDGVNPVSFKLWKTVQPVADKVVGGANRIIK